MKYLIILFFLVTYFSISLVDAISGEIVGSKGLHQYCESCSYDIGTYISQDFASSSKNLIITKNRSRSGDIYSRPGIGLILIKNDVHYGFGIALVRPLYKLF